MRLTALRPRDLQIGVFVFCLALAWQHRFLQDDAFISFRYARNLATGHGLVWNPGERVEGYTNFLWTLLMAAPAATWGTRLVGSNAMVCLTVIPLLSLAPLIAVFTALRSGAPASPALAGALGGLLAAMTGAALYAFHCFDDSPLFVITWYSLATIPVVVLGAFAGSRLLRW